MKLKFIHVVVLVLFFNISLFAINSNKGSIKGEIVDRDTKQKIVGAVVEVLNTNIFAASDVDGNFFNRRT